MILYLIGPNGTKMVNYWMEDEAPSVVYNSEMDRVWVKGANSRPSDDKHRYYEQKSARYIPESFMTPVDKEAAV